MTYLTDEDGAYLTDEDGAYIAVDTPFFWIPITPVREPGSWPE